MILKGKKKITKPSNIAPGAKLKFDPEVYELGIVKRGEKRTMEFRFTNVGSEPIIIELATGCKCSEIKAPEGKSFAPGESGTIKVVFDSNLEPEPGPHKKVVDILLENTDPKTGYQVIEEIWYQLVLE